MHRGENFEFNAFTRAELDQLKIFHEQAVQISNTYFINNGSFNSAIRINCIKGDLNTSLDGPDDADIRSIVLLVRPMTLAKNDKTRICIDIILEMLINRSANDKTRSYVQALLKKYVNRSDEPKLELCCPHGFRTESDIINYWVNGYYFHKDSSKRKELDDLMKWPPMAPIVKGILVNWIIDSCNWALLIDSLLAAIIEKDHTSE